MSNVLVVGATSGLGSEVAKTFHDGGWGVGVLGRDDVATKELYDRLQLEAFFVGDVTDYSSLLETEPKVGEFAIGGLTAVINCTGANTKGPVQDLEPEKIAEIIGVNYLGVANVIKAYHDLLVADGGGRHVAVTSFKTEPNEFEPVYASSKAAAKVLLQSYAMGARRLGVSVTNVAPGALEQTMANEQGLRNEQLGGLSFADAAGVILNVCNLPWHVDMANIDLHSLNRWVA